LASQNIVKLQRTSTLSLSCGGNFLAADRNRTPGCCCRTGWFPAIPAPTIRFPVRDHGSRGIAMHRRDPVSGRTPKTFQLARADRPTLGCKKMRPSGPSPYQGWAESSSGVRGSPASPGRRLERNRAETRRRCRAPSRLSGQPGISGVRPHPQFVSQPSHLIRLLCFRRNNRCY
jgi:hypothetical protein